MEDVMKKRKHYRSKGKPYEMIGFRHVLIYKNTINTTQLWHAWTQVIHFSEAIKYPEWWNWKFHNCSILLFIIIEAVGIVPVKARDVDTHHDHLCWLCRIFIVPLFPFLIPWIPITIRSQLPTDWSLQRWCQRGRKWCPDKIPILRSEFL